MRVVRIVLGVAGGLLVAYGVVRLVHGLPPPLLLVLVGWLAAVVIIQLGVLSPLVLAIGAALRRVPSRARGYVQAGLIMAGAVTIIAVPLMLRQHTQPPVKAMLLQDYRVNLVVLVLIIAVGTSVAYAIRVARDRSSSADRPAKAR